MVEVYLPTDQFVGRGPHDLDLAADYLELKALFSSDRHVLSTDIIDAQEIAAEGGYSDVDAEMGLREGIVGGAVARLASRKHVLAASYPFDLDRRGDVIFFTAEEPDFGQAAYLTSLLLSNLRALSPLLSLDDLHPTDDEVQELRLHFQYFATAAIAAEVQGPAWSFGSPRPDGSGFIQKLSEIWGELKDGLVEAQPDAPDRPQDDRVDVFAWRAQRDGLPGFLLIAAQVATGRDWRNKGVRDHIANAFRDHWFSRPPATRMVAYHVIPFACSDDRFRREVSRLGNVLHRLRVPRRVSEAVDLFGNGVKIEAFDQLEVAVACLHAYLQRVRPA